MPPSLRTAAWCWCHLLAAQHCSMMQGTGGSGGFFFWWLVCNSYTRSVKDSNRLEPRAIKKTKESSRKLQFPPPLITNSQSTSVKDWWISWHLLRLSHRCTFGHFFSRQLYGASGIAGWTFSVWPQMSWTKINERDIHGSSWEVPIPNPQISCIILLFSCAMRLDNLTGPVKRSSSGWFCISIFNTFGFNLETDEWGWQMVAWRIVHGCWCQKRTLNMYLLIEVEFNNSSMI